MDLAPLEPDAFLRWCWEQGPRARGTFPHTVEDLWFDLAGRAPDMPFDFVRRSHIRVASKVRRNQRLGLDPWEGFNANP